MTLKVGDRVRLNKEAQGTTPWRDAGFDYGVVTGHETDPREHRSWHVRWDAYNYRLDQHPTNCHHASIEMLIQVEPDEDELNEVLASIGQAARNTMSTGGSHERRRAHWHL